MTEEEAMSNSFLPALSMSNTATKVATTCTTPTMMELTSFDILEPELCGKGRHMADQFLVSRWLCSEDKELSAGLNWLVLLCYQRMLVVLFELYKYYQHFEFVMGCYLLLTAKCYCYISERVKA